MGVGSKAVHARWWGAGRVGICDVCDTLQQCVGICDVAIMCAGVLEGKQFANVTKAQRLFERALDVDADSRDAKEGYMHCKSILSGALIHDQDDANFDRFVYSASNTSPPQEGALDATASLSPIGQAEVGTLAQAAERDSRGASQGE